MKFAGSLLFLFVVLAAAICTPVFAQIPNEDEIEFDSRTASLSYSFDESGVAHVTFYCSGTQLLTAEQKQSIGQAIELSLKETRSTYESEEEGATAETSQSKQFVYYSARGKKTFAFQNGKVTGELKLASLLASLQSAGYQDLYITISHPDLGVAQFPKEAEVNSQAALAIEFGFHSYKISLAQPQLQTLSFTFGEPDGIRWSKYLPLIAMLVVPIFLALFSARSKLQQHQREPGSVTVISPGWLILLGHGLPMLWWVTLYLTKADRAVKPLLQTRSGWISTVVSIALYIAPPLLTVLICQAIHQYVVGKIKGDEKSAGQLLQQTVLQIVTSIAPSLLFVYGMYAMVTMQGRKGLALLVLFFVLSSIASKWQWKAMGLTPYIVPPGSLRNRIFALAQQAGVSLREAFLIADTNGRTVNAFASSGDNILLTEYLLSQFSRREIDFIVGHEIAHLQRKHIQKNVWISVLTVPVLVFMNTFMSGFVITCMAMLGSMFPALYRYGMSLYMPLAVALSLTLVVMVKMFLSRRFEYEADAGGAALTNDPEAAITALVKLGKLNLEPMDWGKFNGKLLTHPSVKQRVQAIARAYRMTNEQVEQLMTNLDADSSRYAAHTETNDAIKALPPSSEPPPPNLPQAGQPRVLLAMASFVAAGMLLTWLVLTPGYAPRRILMQMHVPAWAMIVAVGFVVAFWFCRHLKNAVLKSMSQHQEYLSVDILESAAITTAAEMNTILAYTNEFEELGFIYVTDYSVAQDGPVPMATFARLFVHPEYHCYAEISHLNGSTLDMKKAWCSIMSNLADDLSISTTNQKSEPTIYASRTHQRFWSCHTDSAPCDLLEIHLEQRTRVLRESGQRLQPELSKEAYFEQLRRMTVQRREAFQQKNILRFMYEFDTFKRSPKTEWWGKFAATKTQRNARTKPVEAES